MATFDDVVIISGCRTGVGKFQGSLADLSAPQLGAIVVREAVRRAKLDPKQVDECILGNVVSAGLGQNPARQAAIFGGLPPSVAALTINKVCGSGLKAVALAAQVIQTGNANVVVAGEVPRAAGRPHHRAPGAQLGQLRCVEVRRERIERRHVVPPHSFFVDWWLLCNHQSTEIRPPAG